MEFNPSENLKEIGSAVQDVVKEKFKYAIVISYAIIWLIFNWDLVYFILFSNDNAVNKIKYINDNFLNYDWIMTFVYFIRNLIIASVLTFVFPVIQVLLNLFSRRFYEMDLETENIKKGANIIKSYQGLQKKLAAQREDSFILNKKLEELKIENKELASNKIENQKLREENELIRKELHKFYVNKEIDGSSYFDIMHRE